MAGQRVVPVQAMSFRHSVHLLMLLRAVEYADGSISVLPGDELTPIRTLAGIVPGVLIGLQGWLAGFAVVG